MTACARPIVSRPPCATSTVTTRTLFTRRVSNGFPIVRMVTDGEEVGKAWTHGMAEPRQLVTNIMIRLWRRSSRDAYLELSEGIQGNGDVYCRIMVAAIGAAVVHFELSM